MAPVVNISRWNTRQWRILTHGSLERGCQRTRRGTPCGIIRAHDSFFAESILAEWSLFDQDKPWIDSGVLSTENIIYPVPSCDCANMSQCTILIPVGHHLFLMK
jgi:hypothetical protein